MFGRADGHPPCPCCPVRPRHCAERVVTEDSGSDVVSLVDDAPAPDYAGVDIIRTVVDHRPHRLRVSVGFRALERDPFQFTVNRVSIGQGAYDITVERLGGKPIISMDRAGTTVDCQALKAKVNLATDVVTTSLPISCLGKPRWVQVGVGAVAVAADQDSPELTAAYAHRDGVIRDNAAKGPKVRLG